MDGMFLNKLFAQHAILEYAQFTDVYQWKYIFIFVVVLKLDFMRTAHQYSFLLILKVLKRIKCAFHYQLFLTL